MNKKVIFFLCCLFTTLVLIGCRTPDLKKDSKDAVNSRQQENATTNTPSTKTTKLELEDKTDVKRENLTSFIHDVNTIIKQVVYFIFIYLKAKYELMVTTKQFIAQKSKEKKIANKRKKINTSLLIPPASNKQLKTEKIVRTSNLHTKTTDDVNDLINKLSLKLNQAKRIHLSQDKIEALKDKLFYLYIAEGKFLEATKLIEPKNLASKDIVYQMSALALKYNFGETLDAYKLLENFYLTWQKFLPLEIEVILCRRIAGFGDYEKFDNYEFSPGQKILLYVSLKNFGINESSGLWNVSIKFKLQGFKKGNVVDEVKAMSFSATFKKIYKERIRDLFIPILVYIPSDIASGDYQLKINVEDTIANKKIDKIVDFFIK